MDLEERVSSDSRRSRLGNRASRRSKECARCWRRHGGDDEDHSVSSSLLRPLCLMMDEMCAPVSRVRCHRVSLQNLFQDDIGFFPMLGNFARVRYEIRWPMVWGGSIV